MWREFREFAVKGNVIDLAIGIIIGTAFGKIVTSLVNDIIMPPIGLIVGKINFDNLYLNLSGTRYPSLQIAKSAGAPTINYGAFINNVLDFLIVAFVMFLVVRQINHLKRPKAESAKDITTKECPYCCSDIPLKASRCPRCTSILSENTPS